jgi:predicted permease
MQTVWQDLRYGLRTMSRQKSFTGLAILALALGIGAVTTIYSVIYNVLIDPFPYPGAQRVVTFYIHDVKQSGIGGRSFFRTAEFLEYQNNTHVFEEAIGGGNEDVLLTTPQGTEQFNGGYVTPNNFAFLGVAPVIGRGIQPEDAKPGAPPVFVMAYKMWSKRYQLDRSILGQTFILNNVPMTLVGIMPPRFTKRGADLWRAVALDPADPEGKNRFFQFQARRKPGVTVEQVRTDVEVVARRLAKIYPDNYPQQFTVQVQTWLDSLVGQFRATLYTLGAAVGLLLLIACGNVANMLLARATSREKEMAVRASLGAGRGRLIRQMLLESLLLALAGAALGCLLAYGGIRALVGLIPEFAIPQEVEIKLNVPVLLFSLGISVLTAVIFGLAPALQVSSSKIVEPLKDAGKGISGGFRKGRLRNTLVVIEVALSMVLLVGAGLLMRTFVAMQSVDLGFNPSNMVVARLPFQKGAYKTAAEKQQFYSRLLARVSALPGVVAATEVTSLPPYGGIGIELDIPGKIHTEKWEGIAGLISEGYFATMGIKIVRGRALSETDVAGARRVAVVNQTLVSKYFGNDDPIGRQIKVNRLQSTADSPLKDPLFEIIGVMTDVKNDGVKDPIVPELAVPYTVSGAYERGILVRTSGNPAPMRNAVRREIWAVDHNVAPANEGTLDEFLSRFTYAAPRFSLILLGVFAGVGLVLVTIGVYSVIAYTVSRQTHEIGIRLALGAHHSDVFGMVLRMGLKLIAIGAAAGLLASFAVTRVLKDQLWNVSEHDPWTLGGVVALITIVGLAACYFPARRATTVDPMIALRYE